MYSGDSLGVWHAVFCFVLMIGIGVLSWQRRTRAVMCGTVLLYAQYMIWRGLYTINMDTWGAGLISWTVYLAEAYGIVQLVLFVFQIWKITEREAPAIGSHRTVDIFVPVVNEPLHILRRTLVNCSNQDYPKGKYRVYVLDDGHREDVQRLAVSLGCHYLRRPDRLHAKAGNLNYALEQTDGELIAMFDTDHAPSERFLMKTVGFFDEEKVAFVQTPQHFYNPDIFQKNLYLERNIPNEQALFFRVIQPGRDSYNSAFFAGSCGMFRRHVLSEVGGFQTGTITEDIHTSLLVHAKGYESRYLNEPLAAGLMPETFESFLKQRARWATGTWQMMFRSNPLTLQGLTWAQRINYLAAIWYFGFGIPRLICLIAPLFGLLLGVAPVDAALWEVGIYYGAYFVASLLMMKTVSRGTRIALWSEVYEVAMCFRTTWAMLTTLIQPYAARPFVITPKGLQQDRRSFTVHSVVPHLFTSALLLIGLSVGMMRWLSNSGSQGIGISLAWGAINLLLLYVATVASIDAQQWRKLVRVPRRLNCTLFIGKEAYHGSTADLSEEGAQICLPAQAGVKSKNIGTGEVRLGLPDSGKSLLSLKGRVRTQRQSISGEITCGIQFVNVDEKAVNALITVMFRDENIWARTLPVSGIWQNIWWLLCVIRLPFLISRASYRRAQRSPCQHTCQGIFTQHRLHGTIRNVSDDGLMAEFIGASQQLAEEGYIHIDHCVLKVQRMWSTDREGKVVAGFRIHHIIEGEQQWCDLLSEARGPLLSESKAA